MSQMNKTFLDSGGDIVFTQTITPAATAAASAVEQAFTPTNQLAFRVGDVVNVSTPGSGNNVSIGNCRINTTGQIVIQFINPTAGSLTHAAGVFTIRVSRVANS